MAPVYKIALIQLVPKVSSRPSLLLIEFLAAV